MPANILPPIGTRGIYTLNAPFDVKLIANTAYTCVAIRKLSDIVAAGGDPKTDYYIVNGLTDTEFNADMDAGACIVSLQAGSGAWVYVPSSFILKYPDQSGVPYTTLALAVTLSAIPDSVDLTYLKSKMADLVMENIGVTAEVHTVALSPSVMLSQDEHAGIEAARQANITNKTTDYAQLLAAQADLASAQSKITQLENYIKAHPPA